MCPYPDLVSQDSYNKHICAHTDIAASTPRTFQIMLSTLPTPSFFPKYRHDFNSVLSFEVNWATIQCALYLTYYFSLLPSATVSTFYSVCTIRCAEK